MSEITLQRLTRFVSITVKNPFVYVFLACLLLAYFAPGTRPLPFAMLERVADWANWFLTLLAIWWSVNFIVFMNRPDGYSKKANNDTAIDTVIEGGRAVPVSRRYDEVGNRRDPWLYLVSIVVLGIIGLVQQLVAGGANVAVSIVLLLLQLSPLAAGKSLEEQAEKDGVWLVALSLFFLTAFVLLFGPRPFQQVAVVGNRSAPPTVIATATPLPKLTETPKATGTSTPTKIPTVAATATVGRVILPTEVCRVGALPAEAVGKFPWMEVPPGADEFVEFRSLPFSSSERLNGTFKTKGAALYCQTDKKNAQYPLWWRAK